MVNRVKISLFLALAAFLACVFPACSPLSAKVEPESSLSPPELAITPTSSAALAPASPVPTDTQDAVLMPFTLAERGPFWTGNRSYSLVDPSRSGREIRITVHYPALKEFNADNNPITRDAAPDLSGAPYPLILTGPNSGDLLFQSHLASHGFVMVIVRPPGFRYDDPWGPIVIDGPLDFLFALDQLAASPPEELAGLIDTDRTGVVGYSWDGFFSLALGGVRIDPENYLSKCAQAPDLDPPLTPAMYDYYCDLAAEWDPFSAYAQRVLPASEEELWSPITDDRIRAIMPMAPDGAWLYGERGLASAQLPTLILTGTEDDGADYRRETINIYQQIGSADRYLISFIGKNHMMVFNAEVMLRMKHFAAAFFKYYLQDQPDDYCLFSEDFVKQYPDLAWGVYGY